MPEHYSQIRAMLAITRASLKATFRSPQSIFFSLFFPIVLIWIFGSLGGNKTPSVNVAFEKGIDSSNMIYYSLKQNPVLHFVDDKKKDINDELLRGRVAAIIDIKKNADTFVHTPFIIQLRTSPAGQKDFGLLTSALNSSVTVLDSMVYPQRQSVARVKIIPMSGGRKYSMIDFFLPGMIGFSLIGSAVFGIAFTIYSLRETLVLKRMYSTPIRKEYIILGESLAKVVFNLMTVVVLIAFGHFVYGFFLAQGWITFVNMMVISFVALVVFMGFGFFISAFAKNQ